MSEDPAVAEIPEHLLNRSKARRNAIAGGGDAAAAPDASASAAAPAATQQAATPAVSPAAVKAAAAAAVPKPIKTVAAPKGTLFSKSARVLLMAGMPIWAFFYAGTFATPTSTTDTPAQIGGKLYASQCAGCHLSNGAGKDEGGVGRALWKGEAEKTFLKAEEQVAFVRHGSCAVGVAYGNPNREGGEHVALGAMPAFPDLTDEQINAIITYERTVLSGKEYPVEEAGAEATPPVTIAPTTENVCRG
jgi:mono/diheme cytochrome c family protein